jgi:hypothetical protein
MRIFVKRMKKKLIMLLLVLTLVSVHALTAVSADEVSVNKDKACVEVALEAQGETTIRYTLDGSEPSSDSPVYTKPLEIRESCTLKAKSERNGKETRTFEKKTNFTW